MNLRSFLVQTFHYSIGTVLITASSLISFPILTRLFSLDEYGLLSVLWTTLNLLVGFGKAGIQNAVLRFYSEANTGKGDYSLRQYYATSVQAMLATGLGVSAISVFAIQLAPPSWWSDGRLPGLFLLTALLVPIRVSDSTLQNIARAQQRSRLLNTYAVLKRYLGLALLLGVLFLVSRSLTSYWIVSIATDAVGLFVLGVILLRRTGLPFGPFSVPLFRRMLSYGIPMIGYELSCYILNAGDRYVLQAMMGSAAVGLYSATYTACEYAGGLLLTATGQAVLPVYLGIWEKSGRHETQVFLAQALYLYAFATAPMLLGFCAIGPEFITLAAGAKYAPGATIIPYVLAGLVANGLVTYVAAGLYIEKRSMAMMVYAAFSGLLNLVLNVLLIPLMGLAGSALATLVSYVALAALSMRGPTAVKVRIPWAACAKFTTLAVVMYAVVIRIHAGSLLATIAARVVTGALLYGILAVGSDATVRRLLRQVAARIRRGPRGLSPVPAPGPSPPPAGGEP